MSFFGLTVIGVLYMNKRVIQMNKNIALVRGLLSSTQKVEMRDRGGDHGT